MYCGDDVSSVVFDIGQYQVRSGYSGEDVPRCVYPAYVGVTADGEAVAPDQNKQDVPMNGEELEG